MTFFFANITSKFIGFQHVWWEISSGIARICQLFFPSHLNSRAACKFDGLLFLSVCFWAEIELRIHLILPERSIVILVTRSRIHLPALKRFSVGKIGSSVHLSMGCRTSIPFVSCPRKSAVCTVSPANNRHSKWIESPKTMGTNRCIWKGKKSLYLLMERNHCICCWISWSRTAAFYKRSQQSPSTDEFFASFAVSRHTDLQPADENRTLQRILRLLI